MTYPKLDQMTRTFLGVRFKDFLEDTDLFKIRKGLYFKIQDN
jgi:hypothetical protein